MIEAIKSVLRQAAHARRSGESAEAERLYKEAAADAKAKDDATRAKALMGTAQMYRDRANRVSAAICYAEAITLLRAANDTRLLAYALRHAADVRSELQEYAAAASHIDEAIRLYRALSISDDPPPSPPAPTPPPRATCPPRSAAPRQPPRAPPAPPGTRHANSTAPLPLVRLRRMPVCRNRRLI